jgi:hypothetical protein
VGPEAFSGAEAGASRPACSQPGDAPCAHLPADLEGLGDSRVLLSDGLLLLGLGLGFGARARVGARVRVRVRVRVSARVRVRVRVRVRLRLRLRVKG